MVSVFFQEGAIWTVSPGSSTPLWLELSPVTMRASTTMGCGVSGPVVIRPILLAPNSVNHSAPSGPATIPKGWLDGDGRAKDETKPAVVIRPIAFPLFLVNHRAPSGPEV